MPGDDLLLGCGCRKRCCCDAPKEAPRSSAGGNLFRTKGKGTPAILPPDDSPFIAPPRLTLAPLRDLGHTMSADTGANTRRNPNRGSVTAWQWSSDSRTRSVPLRPAITDALVAVLVEAGEALDQLPVVMQAVPVASAPLPTGVLTLWQLGVYVDGQLQGTRNAFAATTWDPVTDVLSVQGTGRITPPDPLSTSAMTAGGWRQAPLSGYERDVYSTDSRLTSVGPYFYTSWIDANPGLFASRSILPEQPLILTEAGVVRMYFWARFEGGTANVNEDGELQEITSWYGKEGTYILTATTGGVDVQWVQSPGPLVTPRKTSEWVGSNFQDVLITTGGGRGDGQPLLIVVTRGQSGSALGDAHLLSVDAATGALTLRRTVPEAGSPYWVTPPGNDARYDLDVNIDALMLNFTPAPAPVPVGAVTVAGVASLPGRVRLLLADDHPLRSSDTLTLPSGKTTLIIGASRGAVDLQENTLTPEDLPKARDTVSATRQPPTSVPGGPGRTRLARQNEAVVRLPQAVSGWKGALQPNPTPDAPSSLLRRPQLFARRPTPTSPVPTLTATFPALPAGWRWADVRLLLTLRTPKEADLVVTADNTPTVLLTLPRSGRHWQQRRVTLAVPAAHTGPLTVTLTPGEPLDLAQIALEAVRAF